MSDTSSNPVQPGAYKLSAAAAYCGGIHPETLRRMVKRGLIKPCRAARHLLFTRVELDRFLAEASK